MKLYFLCTKITTIPYYNIRSVHSSRELAEKMRSKFMPSEQCCVIPGDYEVGQGSYIWYVDIVEEPGVFYTLFDSLCDSREKAYNYIKLLSSSKRKKAYAVCRYLGVFNWKETSV